MFLAWRTQLREARAAGELGRLDEAAQRLNEHKLQQYKPGQEFARELAAQYLGRALRRAEEGNFNGAGHDLAQAKGLDGASEPWQDAHMRICKFALVSVEQLLASGDYSGAQRRLTQFEKQPLAVNDVRASQEAIRRLESAANLAKRAKFAEAQEQLAPALALRPEWNVLAEKLEEFRRQAEEVRSRSETLHAALLAENWNQAIAQADQLLAIAPDLKLAREARQRAWARAGAKMTEFQPPKETPSWPVLPAATGELAPQNGAGTRFMLWVDAVGGFLVCLADEIWIGQAGAGNAIAVPIQAELSRKHAKLTHSGEGYVLEAAHPVSIDGRPVTGKRMLADGEELELARGVRIRFRQPHPLSATAKLEIVSRHRMQPHADAVLLMAESCVLGPKWQDHVICKDWVNDVVLFRSGTDLYCRASEPLEIDGVHYESRGPVKPNSHVAGETCSFSIEMV